MGCGLHGLRTSSAPKALPRAEAVCIFDAHDEHLDPGASLTPSADRRRAFRDPNLTLTLKLMKPQSAIAIALSFIATSTAMSQTALIAHRSHGGSNQSFAATGADNFGEMRRRIIDSVVRTSDTTAIEFTNEGQDTTYNNPYWNNPKISLDSLRRQFPGIKFIGFEKARKQARRVRVRKYRADAAIGAPYGTRPNDPNGTDRTPLLALLIGGTTAAIAFGTWRAEMRRRT